MEIEQAIYVIRTWASRDVFFHGDRVGKTYNSIWNPTKDQIHDARPKST